MIDMQDFANFLYMQAYGVRRHKICAVYDSDAVDDSGIDAVDDSTCRKWRFKEKNFYVKDASCTKRPIT